MWTPVTKSLTSDHVQAGENMMRSNSIGHFFPGTHGKSDSIEGPDKPAGVGAGTGAPPGPLFQA